MTRFTAPRVPQPRPRFPTAGAARHRATRPGDWQAKELIDRVERELQR